MELGEVQRKLAVANCTLCETVECRDSRIQELESMLCNKQQEVLSISNQTEVFIMPQKLRLNAISSFYKTHTHKKYINFFNARATSTYEIGDAGARDATAFTGYGASYGSQRESSTEVGIRIKAFVWYVIADMVLCCTPSRE